MLGEEMPMEGMHKDEVVLAGPVVEVSVVDVSSE
jgi:hypothetical protein